MGFRGRITAVLAVIVVLATTAVSLAAMSSTRAQLFSELDRSLAQVARTLTAGNPDRPGPGRAPRLGALLRLGQQGLVQVHGAGSSIDVLVGDTAAEVSDDDLDQARAGAAVRFSTEVDDAPYRMLAVPLADDRVLVVGVDASEQVRVLQGLVVRVSVIGVLVAGAAGAAGWFAAGRLVGPLQRLTGAAEHVAETGDLQVEVRTEQADEAGRLSRAFDEMLAALAESQAQQQQLVDDAGHELRTPITSILSNAEVLKRHPDLDPVTREQIADDLIGESQELTTMVNSLVDLAGVSGADEEPVPTRLADLAREATRRLPPTQRERVSVAGDAEVVLRPAQMQRALVNLLTNAAKFDPSGGPIEVSIARVDDRAELVVRDHGPGFDPADLPRVFARFYRSAGARGTAGSGLGLAIVKDVVQRNGGAVVAGNHPDGGGVVRISLPTA